jgi:hypothetical protein
VSFGSERLCTKQNLDAEALIELASAALLGAAGLRTCARSCFAPSLFLLGKKGMYCFYRLYITRRSKSKERCGHGGRHGGSGDPRPKEGTWSRRNTHLISSGQRVHADADATPSRQACTPAGLLLHPCLLYQKNRRKKRKAERRYDASTRRSPGRSKLRGRHKASVTPRVLTSSNSSW